MEMVGLAVILGAPITAAVLAVLFRRAMRAAIWIAGLGAALSLAGALALLPTLYQGSEPSLGVRWIPSANISLAIRLDWVALPFLVTEAAVTLFAVIYSWGYHHPDRRTPFFYALLMLFAVGMAGSTLADSMVLFYIFWELMLVASCALIVAWGEGERREAIAFKYFVFTHAGSLAVLIALLLLYNTTGSDSLSALRQGVSMSRPMTQAIASLFIVGFCVKMAVFPLHLWLPDAHTVAPMPVTIMLAAAMLGMGTFGILRFPMSVFAPTQMAPFAVPMMIGGVVSAAYGALMAWAEQEVKRIVAYSSVSQMGYVLFGLGTLTQEGIAGATLHVVYHASVKALLFMCIGLAIQATGKRTLAELGGMGRAMPVTATCMAVGVLAIVGMPPLCLFDSEWMIFAGGLKTPHMWLAVLAVVGSLLTVAYAFSLWGHVFLGPAGDGPKPVERKLPWPMLAVTVLLAVLTLLVGLVPTPLFGWVAHQETLILGGTR